MQIFQWHSLNHYILSGNWYGYEDGKTVGSANHRHLLSRAGDETIVAGKERLLTINKLRLRDDGGAREYSIYFA